MMQILRIWLIKKLAGRMGIMLNLNSVSFEPKYEGAAHLRGQY